VLPDCFSDAPLPGEDLPGVAERDEETPGADPDAVDEDRVIDRLGGSEGRGDVPAPRGAALERAAGGRAVGFGLGVLANEPGRERSEVFASAHVGSASHGR